MGLISSLTQFIAGTKALAGEINSNFETLRQAHNTNDARIDTLETEVRIPAEGGTGIGSYTTGDIIYASADDTLSKLSKGTALQYLRMNEGATTPEWGVALLKEYGLNLTNGTDTEHDIVISAGARWDSTYTDIIKVASPITIAIDAAAGINSIDSGTVANSTQYYIWICSGDSGTGAVFSTSASTPTLPSGYDSYKCCIGRVITNGSANIDNTQLWTKHADGTETYIYTQASGNFPNADVSITHNLNTKNILVSQKAVLNSDGDEYGLFGANAAYGYDNVHIDSVNAIILEFETYFYAAGNSGAVDVTNSANYRLKVIIKTL